MDRGGLPPFFFSTVKHLQGSQWLAIQWPAMEKWPPSSSRKKKVPPDFGGQSDSTMVEGNLFWMTKKYKKHINMCILSDAGTSTVYKWFYKVDEMSQAWMQDRWYQSPVDSQASKNIRFKQNLSWPATHCIYSKHCTVTNSHATCHLYLSAWYISTPQYFPPNRQLKAKKYDMNHFDTTHFPNLETLQKIQQLGKGR